MGRFLATRWRRVMVGILAAGIIVAGVVGLLWATNVFGWRVWRLQEAQSFIGAPLPTEAADIQFTTRTAPARILWLRFSLPTNADIQPFVAAMGSPPLEEGFTPFPAPNPQEAAITWWQPAASTAYSGVYWNAGSKVIEVLADRSDTSQTLVYVRAYAVGRS